VSRNSGTRRIREDTQGHDQGANEAQEDTGGAAGIRKDTTLGRFGTVRTRVQIPRPRPFLYSKAAISESLRSQLDRAVSQFPKEQPNQGVVNGVGVGNVRSQDSDRCHAASQAGGLTG
jgi:hypothetical protein